VFGFLIAFNVSFWGHKRFTFENNSVGSATLPRFFLVASIAFLLNQVLFYCLLKWTLLPYSVALFIVLVTVAGLTFFFSKRWVFKK
jgi:putative flippase GtrA